MTLRLGDLRLASPFLLAPLEGVGDVGFRRLCHQNGAGFTWTEMARAAGLARRNRAMLDLLDAHDAQTPTGAQLLATTERELTRALATLEQEARGERPWLANLRALDLNFGCPSPDVVDAGAGPALLKRTARVEALFRTLAAWRATTNLPIGAVGAKIRLGLNAQEADQKVYLRVVELANEHLDYLTVHARHARQRSREPARWDALREAKEAATIPLLGNGDVFTRADAERMRSQTGVAGILVARGAIRSPWIFRELNGTGAGMPSAEELAQAEREYEETSTRYGTKEKWRSFHQENFERIRTGRAASGVPKNAHMD